MIDEKYKLIKILGGGGSSKVFLAEDSQNNKFAIKVIRKDKQFSEAYAAALIEREHEMLLKLEGHPNIIKSVFTNLEGMFYLNDKTEQIMYNLLEYAEHESLSAFVRHCGGFEEHITKLYILQLGNAINTMHDLGYAHLDVKLENLLLDEYYNLKIADMGSCVGVSTTNGLTNKRRGTNLYMAPEVWNLKANENYYATAADIYSIGITIFRLLTGEFPDLHEIYNELSTNESEQGAIREREIDNKNMKSIGGFLSKEAKCLILSLLNPHPQERPDIQEVLSHPWLHQDFSAGVMEDVYLEMSSRKKAMKEAEGKQKPG